MRPLAPVLALLLAAGPALAAPSACPGRFLDGQAPELRRETLARSARELCYAAFAVLHSGLTRTPLWSAERLTRDGVAAAREMERVNAFHPEPRLPAGERAEIEDYVRSGYDRGHMAPSGDMPDAASQGESFTLANMIPQNPDHNRGLWADIETGVRELARRHGEVYVVTGPVFAGANLMSLKGRVIVPTSVYKAVYVPGAGIAGAYLAPNDPGGTWQVVSVDALTALIGIDVFPRLDPRLRAAAGPLPEPKARRPRPEAGAQPAPPGDAGSTAPAAGFLRSMGDVIGGAARYVGKEALKEILHPRR